MAKSRRVTSDSESKYKIITIGCSLTCVILNLSVAYLYYFHPYPEIFDNKVLAWAALPNLAFVIVLIFLTQAIYRNREQSMKWVFIVLCALLFLEIFTAGAAIIAYVISSDQKLSMLKSDLKIQSKFHCWFFESKNLTKGRQCIPVLKRYIRNRAVFLSTIHIIEFVLLGSEALLILFHYMQYLPT